MARPAQDLVFSLRFRGLRASSFILNGLGREVDGCPVYEWRQPCLTTIPSITLATSSQRSMASSTTS